MALGILKVLPLNFEHTLQAYSILLAIYRHRTALQHHCIQLYLCRSVSYVQIGTDGERARGRTTDEDMLFYKLCLPVASSLVLQHEGVWRAWGLFLLSARHYYVFAI
jgi:hypothetical protein